MMSETDNGTVTQTSEATTQATPDSPPYDGKLYNAQYVRTFDHPPADGVDRSHMQVLVAAKDWESAKRQVREREIYSIRGGATVHEIEFIALGLANPIPVIWDGW